MKAIKHPDAASMPTSMSPMLATLVKKPFTNSEYLFEVKWDGYRILAFCNRRTVRLQSRGGEDYTKKYPTVAKALQSMNLNCVLDGEIVYVNTEGKPDFDALQKVNGREAPIVYYAFDLLWANGKSWLGENLIQRKEQLKKLLIGAEAVVKYSDHFEDGVRLFEQVKDLGLEGIIGKRKDSKYVPGERSKNWLKVTTEKRQEFIIGGWVQSEKRNTFRTLLFGAYENGKLKWKGHAGGGYKEKDMPSILKRLKAIETHKNPFDNAVEYSEGTPHWVKPELVANIKYATTTRSGKIRKPAIFLGFREDKKASEVRAEVANETLPIPSGKNRRTSNEISTSNWPELQKQIVTNKDTVTVGSWDIEVHNIDRELWKGVTKAHLLQYYYSVSKYILPHLENRPLSLHVKPKGPYAAGLYIKDMEGHEPESAEIFTTPRKHKKAGKRDKIDYLVCNNLATLLYVVNLGCIDLNPWTSRTQTPTEPDFIIIDLDPSDEDFNKAKETAKAAKELFDKHKLKVFPKTSGKSGIHLFAPCANLTFPQARLIAENICYSINELVPTLTTTTVTVDARKQKVYLDANQNDYSDTVASVYSVRPYKRPLVSMPIEWRELNTRFTAEAFQIGNVLERIEKKGDLFFSALDAKVAAANNKNLAKFL